MKVLFDISVLGRGFYNNASRTGIYRAIEGLCRILAISKDCCLSLCAFESLRSHIATYQYLLADSVYAPGFFITPIKEHLLLFHSFFIKYYNRNKALDDLLTIYFNTINSFISVIKFPGIYDIFHSTYFPFPDKYSTGKAVRIITIYDLIPLLHPQFFQCKRNHLIKRVIDSIDQDNDFVICISESTKNDLCSYTRIDPSRVFIIPLAADRNIFYKSENVHYLEQVKIRYNLPEEPYLLGLNTLEPRKNIEMLVRCFGRLILEEKIGNLKLVLVGTKGWDYKNIYEEIKKSRHIKNHIIFTGYVPDEDLAGIYSGALAFIYPSFYEGFGLPPLEAMQCGVPVITSNTSSLPEVIGDAGLMIDPNCDDELCHYMLKIIRNRALREDFAAKAMERAKLFSWEKCAQNTLKTYKYATNV
jgi:glycosyltransferase involved in cell wall biosynthesis